MPPDGSTYMTKPDVLSVRSLRDWLRQQDGSEWYCFDSTGGCLLANYLRAMGLPCKVVIFGGWTADPHNTASDYSYKLFPGAADYCDHENPLNKIAETLPHTYAAALARCNEYLQGRDSE